MNAKRVSVRRGDLVRIHDCIGCVVTVESGTAWLTQDGDCRDVVLEADGSFRLDRTGVAIVSTPAAAELVVNAAAGTSLRLIEASAPVARTVERARRVAYEH